MIGDYDLWQIYSIATRDCPIVPDLADIVPLDDLTLFKNRDLDEDLRKCYWSGPGAVGFVLRMEDEPAAICWYCTGRALVDRNVGPADADEAELIEIAVAKPLRNKGLGTRLIVETALHLRIAGFRRRYAQIWHSNRPSQKAFHKAGWRKVAIVYRVAPQWLAKPIEFRRRTKSAIATPDILDHW